MRLALAVMAAALCLPWTPAAAEDPPAAASGAPAAAPVPPAETSAAAPSGDALVAVVLESGATFKGQVVSRDERTLKLRSPSGIVRDLPLQSIRSIVPWTDAHEAARAGRTPAPAAAPAASTPASPASAPAPTASAAPATLNSAAPAPAAPAPTLGSGTRAGIGVAMSSGSPEPIVFFPIQVSEGFRIEPEFSLRWASSGSRSVSSIGAGLGFFAVRPVISQVRAYVGPRVEVSHASGSSGTSSDTVLGAAFAVGGEWAPVSSFSFGAEVNVGLAHETREGVNALSTDALLFLRFFL